MNELSLQNVWFIVSILVSTVTMIVAIFSLVHSQKASTKVINEANNRLTKQLQQNYELRTKQSQEQFFAEYTRRYHDIISKMPNNENNSEYLKYLRLYFDLCNEEFHLHKKGLIDEDVWKSWVERMQDDMKCESFRNVWQNHLGQYYYDKDFIPFMNHEIMKQ